MNHAFFKSLLFLGAGSVQHATGTPRHRAHGRARPGDARHRGCSSSSGAAAICGLPPLNGFVSEWLVALASLRGMQLPRSDHAAYLVLATPVLALIGGLAAACFAKVHGTVFLGQPRSDAAARAHESGRAMLLAHGGARCLPALAIGLGPALAIAPLARAATAWAALPADALAPAAVAASAPARSVSLVAAALVAAVGLVAILRRRLGRPGRAAPLVETWGCGYAAPTPRMEYTGSSFAQILGQGFRWVLFPRVRFEPPRGIFPRTARFATDVPDAVLDRAILPAVRAYELAAGKVRGIFPGRIHLYAVLVLLALVAMLAWRFVWW